MPKEVKPISPLEEKFSDATVSQNTRKYRSLVVQGYVLIAIIGFAILAIFGHFFPYFSVDLKITQFIQTINYPIFTDLMIFISLIGRDPIWPALIIFCLILLLAAGLKWESLTGALSAVGFFVLGSGLKDLVARVRPNYNLVHVLTRLTDYGFPSGHTLSYTAFFGFLWFLAYGLLGHSLPRTILLFIFGALVVLVGPSRIYSGEHWASDVVGAYFLGSIWLAVTIYFYRFAKKWKP